jgi:hypothetical protein
MSESTVLDLDAAEQRCQKATPGPWSVFVDRSWGKPDRVLAGPADGKGEEYGFVVVRDENCFRFGKDGRNGMDENNFDFIAHARTDLPAAIAMLREYERIVEGMGHEQDCLTRRYTCNWFDPPCAGCSETCIYRPGLRECSCIRRRLLAVGGGKL